jgi:hypothetical protein
MKSNEIFTKELTPPNMCMKFTKCDKKEILNIIKAVTITQLDNIDKQKNIETIESIVSNASENNFKIVPLTLVRNSFLFPHVKLY